MNIEAQLDLLTARCVDLHSRAELEKKLVRAHETGKPLRIKYGADPSAPDIHLGHTVGLRKLREFQDLGHTVVFIIGDFTGMIGDPSGKSKTRKALSKAEVAENAKSYQEQVFKVLDPDRTELRFNGEWFTPMTFDEVIRLSAQVTVAQMLQRDDFAKRHAANQPISLVEFLYPLVQGHDSVVVEADVELGGTDQLFNLLLGRELQKQAGQEPQVVMTLPLLEGLDGVQKMSKSLHNYVGISEPAKDMFGKMMSVSDELMWRYFSLVLGWPDDRVAALKAEVAAGTRNPREVKDELARAIITLFHPAEEALAASEEFARVFSKGALPDDIPEVVLEEEIQLLDLLAEQDLVASKGEGRRLLKQNAVKIDDEAVTDPFHTLTPGQSVVIKVGKRRFLQVK
ncbi:MAG: tyrosine--tRNA ligase [Verrucomicrobia bacterium]|nr:tyrosine--tRNA ligase [Verrucomicrobiota bacterium]MCH8510336.1 tyrosine--tRNA ligase [Kiritimatiellia bacterium]